LRPSTGRSGWALDRHQALPDAGRHGLGPGARAEAFRHAVLKQLGTFWRRLTGRA